MTTKNIPYMRGINFGFAAPRGWYGSDEALTQIPKRKALNIDCVAAHVTYVMQTYSSTRVFLDPVYTPGDAEVIRWVRAAREAGLKVMLKPILEPLDGIWRGLVNPPSDGVSTFEFRPHCLPMRKLSPNLGSRWSKLDFLGFSCYTDPAGDQGFTIAGKPATETLKRLYAQ